MQSFINRTIIPVFSLVRRHNGWLAAALLTLMGALAFGSMVGNSAIIDEVAHIPAGYSYLKFSDYRLNPEHPPLIKDISAIPLMFMDLKFPTDLPAWTTEVNGQWESGWHFLYHIGNDADSILFWSRLPLLLLTLGFGAALFYIVRKRWGAAAGLLALFFYALSPNILANSTLVTTDVGASIFMFLALAAFVHYVEHPGRNSFMLLALALTAAQLSKFSSLLLYPFLGIISLALVWLWKRPETKLARFKTYVGGFIGASAASAVGIYAFYATQVMNMSQSTQNHMISGSFIYPTTRFMADVLIGMNQGPLMQPLVQYLTGIGMVYGRVTGGNVTYFNGEAISGSFKGYFPQLFLMKTQLALILLGLGLLAYAVWRARNTPGVTWMRRLGASTRNHLFEWILGFFAGMYFLAAIAGNLDLGLRHILPIYIPIFVLAAVGIVHAVRRLPKSRWGYWTAAGVAGLVIWYGGSTLMAFPHFLSYFNETIGGGKNADKHFSDSSVDWGQDLKRLKTYVESHPEIDKIAIDYFGGGVPAYYFCPRKYTAGGELVKDATGYDCDKSPFVEWHAQNGTYTGQYIAVSETFLMNDIYYAKYYNQPGYDYLRVREPVAKVGNSIYVYKLY